MPQANAAPGMRRVEIRTVLNRNKGSKQRLASELGISASAVSIWLSGRSKSARVAAAAEKLASELLSNERESLVEAR